MERLLGMLDDLTRNTAFPPWPHRLLNPERVIVGSIYGRQQTLLEPPMLETLRREALPRSLEVCRVVPAELGESIGDYAGLPSRLIC